MPLPGWACGQSWVPAGGPGRKPCRPVHVLRSVNGLGASFAFPFRDAAWLRRTLVGAALEALPILMALPLLLQVLHRPRHLHVVALLPFLPVLVVVALATRFLVLGYLVRTAKGTLDGTLTGLPPWDQMGRDLVSGLMIWLVSIALWLPAVAVTVAVTLLTVAASSPSLVWLPIVLVGMPAALVTIFYLPAGLLATIAREDATAAVDFHHNLGIVGAAFGPYVLAFLVAISAQILAQLGLLLCCVGILATRFIAHCVAVHAFATAYREGTGLSTPRG